MKLKLSGNSLIVTREPEDKKYHGTVNGEGESNFLHDLKKLLNEKGFELVKTRMGKDGHLVDDMQQYLKPKNDRIKSPHIYLYSNFWALRGLNDDFNKGEVEVSIEWDIFNKQPECIELTKKLIP